MEFWEFNLYVKGYKEVFYNEQMNLMKQSYYTGMFSKDTKNRPKSLEYYLNQIEKQFRKDEYKNKPVDTDLSKSIHKRIQELKKKGAKLDEK